MVTIVAGVFLPQQSGPPDTTAPSAPSTLTVTLVGSVPSLAWLPSTDNVQVEGYQVWRKTDVGGVYAQIGTATILSYADNSAAAGNTYYYKVFAFDPAGNVSNASNEVNQTVGSTDITAPSVVKGVTVAISGATNLISFRQAVDANQLGTGTGVHDYQVFRDGVQLAGANGAPAADLAVNPTFTYNDLGSPAVAGSFAPDASGLGGSMQSAGSDFWGTADQGGFYHAPWTGDGEIEVDLTSFDATTAYAKSGIMFRADTNAGSAFVHLCYNAVTNTLSLDFRATAGAAAGNQASITLGLGCTFRLVRVGNVFTAYGSSSSNNAGLSFGSVTVALPSTLRVGKTGSSKGTALATSVFKNLTLRTSSTITVTDLAGGNHNYTVVARDGASPPNAAAASASIATPTSASFGVKVVGNAMQYLTGAHFIAQGAFIGNGAGDQGQMIANLANNFQASDWTAICNKWFLNNIRISVNDGQWNANTNNYRTNLTKVMDDFGTAGIVMLVNLWWSAPNSYNGGIGDGQPGYLAEDQTLPFCTSLGNVIKTRPWVVFEFLNEPFADNTGVPWNNQRLQLLKLGTTASGQGTFNFYDQVGGTGSPVIKGSPITVCGFQQMRDAVRATGATNVCVYGCPGWSNYLTQSPNVAPTDTAAPAGFGGSWTPQMVASVHYAPTLNYPTPYTNIMAGVGMPGSQPTPVWMTEYNKSTGIGGIAWMRSKNMGYTIDSHSTAGWSSFGPTLTPSLLLSVAPWTQNNDDVFTNLP